MYTFNMLVQIANVSIYKYKVEFTATTATV